MADKLTKLRQPAHIVRVALLLALVAPSIAIAETGCRTGGEALANAFVRANPINAYYFGSLESYVSANRAHFRQGGDSIRCATALSQAFLSSTFQAYDPSDLRRRDELNARMGAMGINPGPQQPTVSQQLFGISMQLSRLARVLPPAAVGNYEPLYTPANELEQMQIFAGQMFQILMQDPTMAYAMADIEPIVHEGAQLEYRIILQAAAALANSE